MCSKYEVSSTDTVTTRLSPGVDLTVKSGECVALLGPNGAGETTLVRNVIGLIEGHADLIEAAGGNLRSAEPRRRLGGAVALRAENRRIAHWSTIAKRERITRDVYDIAGQALITIIVRTQLVQRLAPSDQRRATEEADEVERITRDALSSIRGSVAGWHQASLLDELAVARDALATGSDPPREPAREFRACAKV